MNARAWEAMKGTPRCLARWGPFQCVRVRGHRGEHEHGNGATWDEGGVVFRHSPLCGCSDCAAIKRVAVVKF